MDKMSLSPRFGNIFAELIEEKGNIWQVPRHMQRTVICRPISDEKPSSQSGDGWNRAIVSAGNGFVDVARRPFALCKCAGNIERGPFPHSTGVEVPRISRRQGQVTERAGYWSYQRNPIPKGSAYHLKHYQHSGKVGLWLNLPTKRRSLHRCPEVASSMPCPSFLEIWIIESILQYIGCVE